MATIESEISVGGESDGDALVYDGFLSYSHAADDLLAPRLQSGLQRFAKPWWKRRALRIFRDESSLSANPHLWSSITEALDLSGWFVLLLSPDAAESQWVNQEIEYWKEYKDPSRILPVLTDGTFEWSDSDVSGTAVPEQLQGSFLEEPRWVDMRFARDETDLDLNDPRFADAVADVASALRGVPKDELASEEVKQHRRTMRTAWAAGALVLLLGLAAAFAAIQASQNAEEARRLADAEAESRASAEQNADLAEAREFAASSIGVLDQDPELAVLLGVHAIQIAPDGDEPPPEARIALRQALHSSFIKGRYPTDLDIRLGDVSEDGSRLVVTTDTTLTLFQIDPWEPMWVIDWDDLGFGSDAQGCLGEAWFANDAEIVIGFLDEVANDCTAEGSPDDEIVTGVAILSSEDGAVLRSRLLGPCPASVVGPPSPDGVFLPVVRSQDGDCERSEAEWAMELLDYEDLGTVRSFSVPSAGNPSWSSDAQRLSHSSFHGDGTSVFDAATGDVLVDQVEGFFGQLSPDGSVVATSDLGTTVLLYDVETGFVVDRLHDVGDSPGWISFSDDGALIFAGGRGSATAVWNGIDGRLRALIPNTGPVSFLEYHDESQTLYHVGESDLTTWDLSVEVLGSRNSADLETWVQGNSVVARGTRGVLLGMIQDHDWSPFLRTFDPMTGLIGDSTLDVEMGRPPAILPDGRVIAWPVDRTAEPSMMGPVVVWDPSTDSTQALVGCQVDMEQPFDNPNAVVCADGGEFFDFDRSFAWDDQVAVTSFASDNRPAQILLYDADTLDPVDQIEAPFGVASIEQIGAGWVVGANLPTSVSSDAKEFTLYRLPSWEALATVPASISQPSSDGSLLAVPVTGGPVRVLDTSSGEVVAELHGSSARVRGLAFSLDAGFQVGQASEPLPLLMTSATDGFVRVWDLASEREIDRIPINHDSGDGVWLDPERIAIGTATGLWTTLSIDRDELLDFALERLQRSFTEPECEIYRIDPCPTLDEIRGR